MIVERTEWNAIRPPWTDGNYNRPSRTTREWRSLTFLFSFYHVPYDFTDLLEYFL